MEQLDPKAYNMMRAIRQVESGGNFNARSKDGSYGAYQFIKPTWDATAPKYGVFAQWEKATPGEQNKVAYKQIKEWVDKGFNAAEIASMWNAGAGRPNAYKEGLKGTNSSGVNYNVAKYAEKVGKLYQQLKQEASFNNQGSTSTQPEEVKPEDIGFVQSVVRGIVNPFLRPLVNAKKLGEVLTGQIKTQEEVAAPVNFGSYLGEVKPIGQEGDLGQKLKDSVGAGFQIGANVVGGSGVASVGKSTLGGLIKQGAIQGAETGFASGASYGLGSSLEQNENTFNTVKNTALGAAGGLVTGAATGAAFPLVSTVLTKGLGGIKEKAVQSQISKLEDVWTKTFKATKSGVKLVEKSAEQDKNAAKFLANKLITPNVEGTKYVTKPNIVRLEADLDPLNRVMRDVLDLRPEIVNLNDLKAVAIKQANNTITRGDNTVRKVQQEITKEMDDYIRTYGENVKLSIIQDIKVGQAKRAGIDKLVKEQFAKDANYQISNIAKNIIEKKIGKDVAIRDLNKFIGDHYDAIKLLKKINGQTVKGGRLGKYAYTIGGIMTGNTIVGKIAGGITGNYIADIMMNLSVSNPLRELILRYAQTADNAAYQQALQYIARETTEAAARLKLPAGATPLGGRTNLGNRPINPSLPVNPQSMNTGRFLLGEGNRQINLPQKGVLRGQENIR